MKKILDLVEEAGIQNPKGNRLWFWEDENVRVISIFSHHWTDGKNKAFLDFKQIRQDSVERLPVFKTKVSAYNGFLATCSFDSKPIRVIYIDGEVFDDAPANIKYRELLEGNYSVKIVKDGFEIEKID